MRVRRRCSGRGRGGQTRQQGGRGPAVRIQGQSWVCGASHACSDSALPSILRRTSRALSVPGTCEGRELALAQPARPGSPDRSSPAAPLGENRAAARPAPAAAGLPGSQAANKSVRSRKLRLKSQPRSSVCAWCGARREPEEDRSAERHDPPACGGPQPSGQPVIPPQRQKTQTHPVPALTRSLTMAEKSPPGLVGGPHPRSRTSPFSTVTRGQEDRDNSARKTSIDIFVANEDTNYPHPLELTPPRKGFP